MRPRFALKCRGRESESLLPLLLLAEVHWKQPGLSEGTQERYKEEVLQHTGVLFAEPVASELFGHVKGAFTGAENDKVGRFAEACGGTLFLDEITTMNDGAQVALLRVLEDSVFRPLGGKANFKADVRIVAATNTSLQEAVRQGFLRENLLHRLQVFRIALPPLRERTGKFLSWLRTFWKWPGNIREFRNTIYQAALMAEKGVLLPQHLPPSPAGAAQHNADRAAPVEAGPARGEDAGVPAAETLAPTAPPYDALGHEPFHDTRISLDMSLAEVTRAYVLKVLAYCGDNKSRAAQILGVSGKTLHGYLKKWAA